MMLVKNYLLVSRIDVILDEVVDRIRNTAIGACCDYDSLVLKSNGEILCLDLCKYICGFGTVSLTDKDLLCGLGKSVSCLVPVI
jgi:hypothetical protein